MAEDSEAATTSTQDASRPQSDAAGTVKQKRSISLEVAGFREFLYVFGGDADNTVERYDFKKNKWETVGVKLPDKRSHFALTTFRETAWLIGGKTKFHQAMNSTISFNHLENKFIEREAMPTARHSLGAAELKNRLYVVGGKSKDVVYPITEVYREGFGWKTVGSLGNPRFDFGIASYRGRLYVAGGNDGTSLIDVVEEFTVTNDLWHQFAGKWQNHSGLFASRMRNDLVKAGLTGKKKLYVVGTTAPEFLEDDTWDLLCDFDCKRDRKNLCAVSHRNCIFLIGGVCEVGRTPKTVKNVDRYHIGTAKWNKINEMKKARTRAGAAVLIC